LTAKKIIEFPFSHSCTLSSLCLLSLAASLFSPLRYFDICENFVVFGFCLKRLLMLCFGEECEGEITNTKMGDGEDGDDYSGGSEMRW